MAHVHPEGREPEYEPERRVLAALMQLDDDWHIFPNVKWQALRRGRQADGETDFALFHPTKGVLVIEAKGGDVVVEDGRFHRRKKNGSTYPITDPFEQAADCKRALAVFLSTQVDGLGRGPRIGRAVAFPHVQVSSGLGPHAPRAIILDSADLAAGAQSIDRLVEYWKPPQRLTPTQLRRIRQVLVPSTTIKRLLRDELADAYAQLIELTTEQYDILDSIGGNRQALVRGGAGTGKTLLAVERARRLADLGASVLLVCFNQLLGQKLAEEFDGDDLVTAGTFHQAARRLVVKAGMDVPHEPSQQWWDEELPAMVPDAAVATGFAVDAVIVDEGQDFRPDWWDVLRLTMRDLDDGWFYVFADANQTLFVPGWSTPFGTASFEYLLTKNCRNTRPIAERVARVVGGDVRTNKVEGPKPKFHVVKSVDDAIDRTIDRLGQLLAEQVDPLQIQVLSTSKDVVDRLHGRDVDGVGLVSYGDDGIAVETVHRFKGLEAEAVIVVIPEVTGRLGQSLAYTGLSRALTFLEVIGPKAAMDAIGWDAA